MTSKSSPTSWPLSAVLLMLFGIMLIGMGVYFAALRPPLLPEDLRYIGASQLQLEAAAPRLAIWLAQVFRVMGGYVAATGILMITVAVTAFRAHCPGAAIGVLFGGLVSIGWMAVVNFMIDSDFKWVLLGIALVWACSMGLFWIETLRGGRQGNARYERHYSDSVFLPAGADEIFAHVDDFSRLSSHMNQSSAMMMGASMETSFDTARGQAIGSHVRMSGKMMGIDLSLEEVITEREPPRHKAWETIGSPRLLVIGGYRLGFDITPENNMSELRVFIDYDLPTSRWLGYLFGSMYAKWCVQQMVKGARDRFSGTRAH